MEFLQIIYDSAKWYGFFCIVTAIALCIINLKIVFSLKQGWNFTAYFSYIITTLFTGFIFAPAFFIIIVFYANTYVDTVIKTMEDYE